MHYLAQIRAELLATPEVTDICGEYGVYVDYPDQSVPEPYIVLVLQSEEAYPTVTNAC